MHICTLHKLSDVVSECGSHQLLKCGWCITVSHLYCSALKSAEYCRECGFMHVLGLYVHFLISFCHVQFGPELSTHYIVSNSILLRERCYIFPCIVVLLSQIEHSV